MPASMQVPATTTFLGLSCDEGPPTAEVRGRVGLVQRGNCSFSEKVLPLAQRGVKAVVVINREAADLVSPTCRDPLRGPLPCRPLRVPRPGVAVDFARRQSERRLRAGQSDPSGHD